MHRVLRTAAVLVSASLIVAACGSSDDNGTDSAAATGTTAAAGAGSTATGSTGGGGGAGNLDVSAAASLTDAFTTIGQDFQKANPGTTVTFNFAGSNTLVQQI